MQINLVPQSKELEQQRKKIGFFVVVIGMVLFFAVVAISLILISINLVNNNTISDLSKEIGNTKKDLEGYSKLEKNVNNLMTSAEGVKQILDGRFRYDDLYIDIESLMPREIFLTEISTSDTEVIFKAKADSPEKIAQFIESLRKYEREESVTNEENTDKGISETGINNSEESKNQEENTESNTPKIKLFDSIEVTSYSKEEGYIQFEIKAKIREESWKKG